MLADPEHCAAVLAVRKDGGARRPIGVATAAWRASVQHTRAAELEDLYVVPSERGRGVAGALVDAVTRWSRERGCSVLLVTVTPDGELSHGLTGFYTKRGFGDEYRTVLSLALETRR